MLRALVLDDFFKLKEERICFKRWIRHCASEKNVLVTCRKYVTTDITKQHNLSQVFIAHYPKQS